MTSNEQSITHEGDGFTVSATIHPITPGSHVFTGQYSIDTDAGLDGPYDLGQGTWDELSERFASVFIAATTNKPRKCIAIIESQYVEGRGYVPSMVTEGEAGHSPLTGHGELSEPWYWGHDLAKAKQIAAEFNAKLGLTEDDVQAIVESSVVAQIRGESIRADADRKLGR